jgi:hypothetical protein
MPDEEHRPIGHPLGHPILDFGFWILDFGLAPL